MIAAAAQEISGGVQEAGRIYRRIEQAKAGATLMIEVSLDETDRPQTPIDLLLILALVAEEDIPAQTIAPRFIGRFNKGVDYVGDVAEFGRHSTRTWRCWPLRSSEFRLPEDLKLCVHSGSDKFSIYRPMHEACRNRRRACTSRRPAPRGWRN